MELLFQELQKHNISFIQSMKLLFDANSFIYRSLLYDHNDSTLLNYVRKEKMTLAVQSKIDAIYEEQINDKVLRMWSIATIKSCTDDSIICEFVGTLKIREFDRNSNEIAPLNTFTTDMSWRNKLKKGDQIDVADPDIKWFRGTILGIEENKRLLVRKYRVGFRVYTKNGSKSDELGKFEGWKKEYDEWINSYSIRIQQPNSIVKDGFTYCHFNYDYGELTPEDDIDVLLNV